MIKIRTYPQDIIEKDLQPKGKEKRVLISIVGNICTPLENPGYYDVLHLKFDDLWLDPQRANVLANKELEDLTINRMISANDILEIEKFIKKHEGKDIDVHCAAGISRSGGVACGIAIILEDFELLKDVIYNNRIEPNERVLSRFLEEYNPIYQKFYMRNIFHMVDDSFKKRQEKRRAQSDSNSEQI